MDRISNLYRVTLLDYVSAESRARTDHLDPSGKYMKIESSDMKPKKEKNTGYKTKFNSLFSMCGQSSGHSVTQNIKYSQWKRKKRVRRFPTSAV